jgi:DNA-binding NarL/FixJ family response regulator
MPPVRVLIVDDQEPFRRAAATVLELADGFEVVDAVDSAQACLAAVPVLRPDLVVMDVGLPEMDGIEATRALSRLPRPPVVVLVSTRDEAEFADQARACGAVGYISKPAFAADRLAAVWSLASAGSSGGGRGSSGGSSARSSSSPASGSDTDS